MLPNYASSQQDYDTALTIHFKKTPEGGVKARTPKAKNRLPRKSLIQFQLVMR